MKEKIKKIYIKCKICGSSNNRIFFKKNGFYFIKCKYCKIVYIWPLPSAKRIRSLYEDETYYRKLIEHDELRSKKEQFPWEAILSWIERRVNKGKLLDIGSGTGFFLHLARQKGWEVYGIEPSKFAYDYSVKKFSLNIINRPFREVYFLKEEFDFITFWNLLEHLISPLDILNEIKSILKRRGLIAFSVPNIDSIEAKLFKRRWKSIDPLNAGHFYYFSPYTINFIMKKMGFKILKITTIGNIGIRSHLLREKNVLLKNYFMLEKLNQIFKCLISLIKKGGILIVIAQKG